MKVVEVPLFEAPIVEPEPDGSELQWKAWRKACPLRKLSSDRLRSLCADPAVRGGWQPTLALLADGLRTEIPPALAGRMGTQLADSLRAWIAQRPPLPWVEQ